MTMGSDESKTENRVIGRYLLCDAIASGGMATVHLGRLVGPVGFSRTVAIKRLHPHFARDPEFVTMFLDEARIAARIRHPNVVSTLDVVVLQGELFVVMDYVHGEALSRLVRASGPIDPPLAASIISGVLYGLHSAHEARADDGAPLQIVHRDVSPQNVLVGVDGIARVVDFGVAKAVGRAQTTREGALKGKISYMSPEQVSSENVDRRTDVYAASVVFWEMLTGRRLFSADNEVRVLQQVVQGKIDPPSKHVPSIPREIDALVMKGLSRDANARFATAYEMAEAVQHAAFATPGQVSAWVQRVGGQVIAQRAARVAEVESSPALEPETLALVRNAPPSPIVAAIMRDSAAEFALAPAVPPSPPDSQVSALNLSSSAGRHRRVGRDKRVVIIAAVALIAFAIGAIGIFFIVRLARVDAPPTTAATTPSTETAPPKPLESVQPLVVAKPAETTTASATPSAKPAAHGTATRPRVNACDPPYTIKDGIRVPKMECL